MFHTGIVFEVLIEQAILLTKASFDPHCQTPHSPGTSDGQMPRVFPGAMLKFRIVDISFLTGPISDL